MLGRGGGILNAQTFDVVNERLESAIEDLRVKYAAKAEEEARVEKERKAREAAEDKDAAAKAAAKAEPTMEMDDPELERLRRDRINALRESAKAKKRDLEAGHGELHEIVEEDFLKEVTGTQHVLVHFYHPEFEKCKVMDKHLRALAPRCTRVKMLKLNAEKSPFFTAKLRVRVLPTLVFFKDGVAIGRQVGFDGLTVTDSTSGRPADDFPTVNLYKVLKASGILGEAARERADSDSGDDDPRSVAEKKLAALRAAALSKMSLDAE